MDTKTKIDELLRRKRTQTNSVESLTDQKTDTPPPTNPTPNETPTIGYHSDKPKSLSGKVTPADSLSKINAKLKQKQSSSFAAVPNSKGSSSDKKINSVIAGKYKILSKLGEGGMGSVYKAEQLLIDRICAIKVVSPEAAKNPDVLKRFNREAKLSARLNHPHAVTLYDFGQTGDGTYFIAMEYVEGETLANLLKKNGVLSLARTLEIAKQTGDALAAAHGHNIIHRDLKPENIMIGNRDGRDWIKVLDFGIAKLSIEDEPENLTRTGMVLGTPLYISPEQLYGEKIDARSDLYSFALIIYEMLTGSLPFRGESVQTVMMKRLTEKPLKMSEANLESSVPDSFEAILMAGLAREPDARIPTVRKFIELLESAANPQK